jgi:hypothetical protein
MSSLVGPRIFSLNTIGNYIIAGTSTGVYFSTDYGLNWIQKNQGFGNVYSLRSSTLTNEFIFVGTKGNSVWRRSLSEITGIINISTEFPSSFSLKQNYPNPFNPVTKIRFEIPSNGFPTKTFGNDRVVLKVYDLLGKEIQTLVNEQLQPGTYEVTFDGSNLPSGIYFYQLKAEEYFETRKMLLIK